MATNNNDKTLNVPPLRFPEFSGEWEEHTLSEYLEFKNGLNPDAKRIGSGLPFISVMDILSEGVINYDNIRGKVNATEKEIECFGVKDGDLLFQRSSETLEDVGRANVYMDNRTAIYGGFVIRGRKIGNYDPLFFKYLLATPLARKRTCRMGAGAQHFNIGQEGLSKISLYFPSIEEQRKIAEFLSLIDERIATQNKIIEDLKKLKSAIVDKLYSSTNGKTYSFCQLFEVVNEKNKKLAYKNVLSASQELGMIERSDINIDIKFEQESISGYKIVRKGDYVVHLRSFQGGFAFSDTTGICSPAYTILRPNDLVVYGYLSHFFTSKPFIKSLKLVTYGIRDGRSINVDEWLDMPILLPSAQEQMRILTIVNAIDAKLHNEAKVQFCLSSQKSYLLNTMFI